MLNLSQFSHHSAFLDFSTYKYILPHGAKSRLPHQKTAPGWTLFVYTKNVA